MREKRVAVLYLCSGTYIIFWKLFYLNYKKHFLNHSDVHFYVFTDAKDVCFSENDDVHIRYVEPKGWPGASLMRYHFFCEIEEEIRKYDYCYFMNACMHCMCDITEEELFVNKGKIVVVEHPIHTELRLLLGSEAANRANILERNERGEAYIPSGQERTYVIGAINGGDTSAFMDMSNEIKSRIDKDGENGIMPPGFDESYLNHYIYKHDNYVLLGSEYCHPQVLRLPVNQKIMILEKVDLLDVYSVKNGDGKELNNVKRKLVAEQEKKTTLQKILLSKNGGIAIEKALKRRGCSSIAIYGYRDMGDFLCCLLDDTEVSIKYVIDNRIEYIEREIPVIKEEEIDNMCNVDCIVIAHPSLYYGVLDRLCDKLLIPAFSIDELAHEGYMEELNRKC